MGGPRGLFVLKVLLRKYQKRVYRLFSEQATGSQIGAWTSNQSSDIASRDDLVKQEEDTIAKFEGMDKIPKPPHWGGFRLVPSRIEFWKGRESRLHDRIVYEKDAGGSGPHLADCSHEAKLTIG